MLVEQIMTAPVLTIAPSGTVGEALALMLEHHVGSLPVVTERGHLAGIVTEGDLLRRSEFGAEEERPAWAALQPARMAEAFMRTRGRRVEEVMSLEVLAASHDTSIEGALEAMIRHRVGRLPVLEGGTLVGIVSRSDVLRALAATLSGTFDTSDEEIRSAIEAELGRHIGAGRYLIGVAVTDGVVDLRGTVFDGRHREAARLAVENLPGVRSVVDNIAWVDPQSGLVVDATNVAWV